MSDARLIGAGWKSISLIDVVDSVTFTVWLCGCNLSCPFCHNWKLASNNPEMCDFLDSRRLLEDVEASRGLIDFLHVTGGEPLVQYIELGKLLRTLKESYGIEVSLNTNLTLTSPLSRIIEEDLVDHLATDFKVPPDKMFGLSSALAQKLWQKYEEGLSLVADHQLPLELRIPIAKFTTPELLGEYLRRVERSL
ncbi:MAG: anaerobic ribonucleoside-triphosphate reductase activating protein, partial [Fervidicoccaceae archaeon]